MVMLIFYLEFIPEPPNPYKISIVLCIIQAKCFFSCKYIHTADYIIVYTLTYREYKVELLDRSFQPMILLIEEGDRVWWF
jgi:hypothetical protein